MLINPVTDGYCMEITGGLGATYGSSSSSIGFLTTTVDLNSFGAWVFWVEFLVVFGVNFLVSKLRVPPVETF